MTLKSDAKFEGKLARGLKNGMRNQENFHQSTGKCQNWDIHGVFCLKQKMYVLKIQREAMCHENE